jgi:hypothetical protein
MEERKPSFELSRPPVAQRPPRPTAYLPIFKIMSQIKG